MKRLWLLALACVAASTAALSQTTLTILVRAADTGEPVDRAVATLTPGDVSSTTGADGIARFGGLARGSYVISVRREGFDSARVAVEIAGAPLRIEIPLSFATLRLAPMNVEATRARERFSPVTFSEISGAEIRDRRTIEDVPELVSTLPSITQYSESGNGIGYSYISLRGFDQRRLAVMINGVPQNDPEDHNVYWIDMPDLLAYTGDIQVQRGAGSAFSGPPAIGGSINIITAPAFLHSRTQVSSAFGFQEFGGEGRTVLNTRRFGIFHHSGLIDGKYMLFGNLSTIASAGYRRQAWTNLSSYFLGAVRYDSAATLRIHLYGGPLADGLAYVGIPKFYNADLDLRRVNDNFISLNDAGDSVTYAAPRKLREQEEFFQPHYEILHEWRIAPGVTLNNTLFFIRGDGYFDYDGDWIPYDPSATQWFRTHVGFDSAFGATSFPSMLIRGYVSNRQWGWQPRLRIDQEAGALTLGGELRFHRSEHWGKIQESASYPAGYDFDGRIYDYRGGKDMISLFGSESFTTGATTLMGNLQLVYNRYRISDEKFLGNDFSVSYLFVNPRLGVNHNFSEAWNGYLSAGYTSREPRLRNLYAAEDAYFGALPQFDRNAAGTGYDFSRPFAKPEQLLDLECGAGFSAGSLRLNGTLYWMEFTHELVSNGRVDIFGNPVTGNADRSRHVGLELEGKYALAEELEAEGNISLSRNRLVRYRVYDANGAVSELDGNPISGFPDVLGNLRIAYHPGSLSCALSLRHVGAFYTDNTKNGRNRVDAYSLVDADCGYEIPRTAFGTGVTLKAKARNLFNRLYLAQGEGNLFFPGAERNYIAEIAVTL